MCRRLPVIASVLLASHLAFAQNAADGTVKRQTFRSGVEAVEVVINVMGKDGAPPKTLARDDFRLTENGVEQMITAFLEEHPSSTMTRFTVGYTSSHADIVRKIEVRIRGFRKRIKLTFQPEVPPAREQKPAAARPA